MQRPPNSQPMDYARASAELNRMAAQYGSSAQESTPRHFPDEFSTPGASRERPLRFDAYGNYGATPSMQPSLLPPFDHSYGAYHSPGGDSAPGTPAPAVIEAYRELNNKAAVVNQQRLAAQRERDRLRAELDLYLKQEGLERIVRTQVQEEPEPDVKVEASQPPPRQVPDLEREEIERQKAELKRQMKQYEELRRAEEAANARHIEAKREAQHLHKLLEELQSQSAHLERSLRASSEQVRRLERQLGEDRQARAQQEDALRQKIDRLQQAVQAEMRAREELIEKAKRDEENMANLAAAAREAINLSQAAAQQQQQELEAARQQQHYQQHDADRRRRQKEADQATVQFEEFLERTRDSIRSLIHRADDVLAAVRNVSMAEPPRRSPKPPRHSQATQTPGRRRSRGMSAEIPAPHVSSASGSRSGSGSSTAESMSDHAFYEFTHERSMHGSDASDDAAMLERIEGMIPSEGGYGYGYYDEDEYASYEGHDTHAHKPTHRRVLHEPPRRVRTQSRRRSRPCERWAAPPPRKVVPMSEPPPVPFIPSASGKSFNLIGNLSEAARDLKLSYPPHLLETEKGYARGFPKMRGTVDPAFQEEVEQMLLVELEDLEDRLQHLRDTSQDKALVASLQDRIAHTREQLLAIREASEEEDFRQLSPERQRNTAMLHALQERRYYREHARVPPI